MFTSNGGTPRWGSRRALLGCSLRIPIDIYPFGIVIIPLGLLYPIGAVYTAALTDGWNPMSDKRYIFDVLQHNLRVPDAVSSGGRATEVRRKAHRLRCQAFLLDKSAETYAKTERSSSKVCGDFQHYRCLNTERSSLSRGPRFTPMFSLLGGGGGNTGPSGSVIPWGFLFSGLEF